MLLCSAHLQGSGRPEGPLYFDMGTAHSPLAENHVRVLGENSYDSQRGWGFEGRAPSSFLLEETQEQRKDGRYTRMENFRLLANNLNRDGVRGEQVIFRVDVAPGTYRLTVTLGDLLTSMGSVRLFANDKLIQENIAFQHAANRALSGSGKAPGNGRGCYGMYDRLRFLVEAPEGVIRLRLDGDQSDYDRLLKRETEGPRLRSWINGREMDHDTPPYRNIGEPFQDVPLLGVEIAPATPAPVEMLARAELSYPGQDNGVRRAVSAFNAGDFAAAKRALTKGTGPDSLARGLCFMWLAGWLANADDPELVTLAAAEIHRALLQDGDNTWARSAREECALYLRALRMHLTRSAAGKDHFTENQKAHHFFGLIQRDSPLYWRARLHGARCAMQLDPHRWVSSGQVGLQWFEEIKQVFPNDPYAVYFTTDQHDSRTGPWELPNVSALYQDRDPEWAKSLHSTYNHLLSLSEWWVKNRQRADGSFGGGMDDDVELVRLFGYYGLISEGSAPELLEATARLVRTLYEPNGSIDPESGYPWVIGDSEHTAELTGNTLPLMMLLDYGNPLWIERGMQVGKLFRDVWSAKTLSGHRHFRSNFIGGLGVGSGLSANDSIINRRCLFPAERVLWYNGHPALKTLIVEWAEAWLEDSSRTDKGKPKGFLPSNIAFETEEMNGIDAPSWYLGFDSKHGGSVNYDFGSYYGYHVGLMDLAYDLTGAAKFLEPARLGAAYYESIPNVEASWNAPHGSPAKIKYALISAYKRWKAHTGEAVELDLADQPLPKSYEELEREYEPILRALIRSWPVLTSEASATDRIQFEGMPRTFRHYTGGAAAGDGELDVLATYGGVGRDFAATITKANGKTLDLSMYVFREGQQKVDLRPWALELGATYHVDVSPDVDLDLVGDEPGITFEFEATHRGQSIQLPIMGRQTQLVRIRQIRRGSPVPPLADLGLSEIDLQYNQKFATLTIRVHNTGTASAEKVDVLVYRGEAARGEPLARLHLPHIGWPMLLDPQTVKLGFRYRPGGSQETFTVVIDPLDQVREITESNNRLTKTLQFDSGTGEGRER